MMSNPKKIIQFVFLSCLLYYITFFLSACSPIDSLKPFDSKQIMVLLNEHHTKKPTQQMIQIDLPHPESWRKIDLSWTGSGSPSMFVLSSESASDWTESIRTIMIPYADEPQLTPKKWLKAMQQHHNKHCKITTNTLQADDPNIIMFEFKMNDCDDRKAQMQIGKAFKGIDALYVVYYTVLINDINKKEINAMRNMIARAKLVENRRRRTTD